MKCSAICNATDAILRAPIAFHRLLLTLGAQGMPMSFDTSHNKKVEGNYTGLVKRDTKRSARQYMNRIGNSSLLNI